MYSEQEVKAMRKSELQESLRQVLQDNKRLADENKSLTDYSLEVSQDNNKLGIFSLRVTNIASSVFELIALFNKAKCQRDYDDILRAIQGCHNEYSDILEQEIERRESIGVNKH